MTSSLGVLDLSDLVGAGASRPDAARLPSPDGEWTVLVADSAGDAARPGEISVSGSSAITPGDGKTAADDDSMAAAERDELAMVSDNNGVVDSVKSVEGDAAGGDNSTFIDATGQCKSPCSRILICLLCTYIHIYSFIDKFSPSVSFCGLVPAVQHRCHHRYDRYASERSPMTASDNNLTNKRLSSAPSDINN